MKKLALRVRWQCYCEARAIQTRSQDLEIWLKSGPFQLEERQHEAGHIREIRTRSQLARERQTWSWKHWEIMAGFWVGGWLCRRVLNRLIWWWCIHLGAVTTGVQSKKLLQWFGKETIRVTTRRVTVVYCWWKYKLIQNFGGNLTVSIKTKNEYIQWPSGFTSETPWH